jgi:multidrug efflux pump subunit AcrA (membrane-fusion protein)
MGNAVHPEDDRYDRRGRAGLLAGVTGPSGLEFPHACALYLGQPSPGQPSPGQQAPGQPPPGQPAPRPVPPAPADQPRPTLPWPDQLQPGQAWPDQLWLDQIPPDQLEGQHAIRRARTWPQRIGGLLIAAAVVAAAVWYIPSVMHDNRQLFTGTVASSGVVTLNFSAGGEISELDVKLNATVKKGEVLAKENAPDDSSLVAADKDAIQADQYKIAQLKETVAADPANVAVDQAQLSTAKAQLSLDQAQLSADQLKILATEIIAPAAGVIVAANGQLGQTVTTAGIREYGIDSQQQSAAQGPAFSLLPEGPQTGHRVSASASAVPVFALRTSINWQVIVLVPESSVSRVQAGQRVAISVPSDHVKDVPGQVSEVPTSAAQTSAGVFYQVVVSITGHSPVVPLNGMTADVQFGT